MVVQIGDGRGGIEGNTNRQIGSAPHSGAAERSQERPRLPQQAIARAEDEAPSDGSGEDGHRVARGVRGGVQDGSKDGATDPPSPVHVIEASVREQSVNNDTTDDGWITAGLDDQEDLVSDLLRHEDGDENEDNDGNEEEHRAVIEASVREQSVNNDTTDDGWITAGLDDQEDLVSDLLRHEDGDENEDNDGNEEEHRAERRPDFVSSTSTKSH